MFLLITWKEGESTKSAIHSLWSARSLFAFIAAMAGKGRGGEDIYSCVGHDMTNRTVLSSKLLNPLEKQKIKKKPN